ncbi:5-oxoprolinase subunit C family protein [Gulosibacter molinativorax]|uniref:Allophanate hydrolase n=1 Tax=Gulosibacter molinativorax TaxID=256821 RepID=A0ABT7CA35_9MICO|nr:biotin-dependent carboxyltransferase family protein [Gulosibacter molinativorax]MDJ1372069.1 allophanate hydrolase [Gulosibacter molinativorax]QUY63882.1 Urea carboxylase [Gulosibacter molinativorax]
MSLEIIKPGLSTTVQDRGRFGYYRYGIPQGGAMDQYAAALANRIVGNTADDALLECSYLGPKISIDSDALISVTGAPIDVLVNGVEVEQNARLELEAGDELSFGVIKGGTKFFIAVAGGIDVPEALGSRSTYPIGRIGGLEGRALIAGDTLPVGLPHPESLPRLERVPKDMLPEYSRSMRVRVMVGLYDHKLTDEGLRNLTEAEWTLTPVADRMGLRFDGPGVEWKDEPQPFGAGQDPSNITDAGYPVGSIQIPGGTQPIVLHYDAVSGGGYAQAGTVISADMDLFARMSPGTKVRFVPVDMEEALAARAEARARFDRIWS